MSQAGSDPKTQSTGPQLWQLAQDLALRNEPLAARSTLETLLVMHPRHVGGRMLLASVILATGHLRAAVEQLRIAVGFVGDDVGLLVRLAQALSRLGDTNAARASLRHPLVAQTRAGPVLTALAHVYQGLGLNAEALELMDRARDSGYDNADFRYFHGLQLQFNGRLAEAESEMEGCLRAGPTFGRASLSLARIRRQTVESNHVDFIRSRLASVEKGTEDHAAFEFALHKELDDLGQIDQAWSALERANAVMASRLPYDAAEESRLFDAIIQRFDHPFTSPPTAKPHPGPTPIFIVGMPRSGTTLLERILGSHSQVASAGELTDMPRQLRWVADRQGHQVLDRELLGELENLDFQELGRRYLEQSQWRARGRGFYIDKLPPNFMLIGCIRRALPGARILHMTRDSIDVCFSNYRAMFGDAYAYSYDLDRLAHHHGQYTRLMDHWREVLPGFVLDVPYAELVQDTETACRRLLEFCGLPFEPGCLDHTRNSASVSTLSSAQVRQPIHTRGLGEWQRYEPQLQSLKARLTD